MSKFPEQLAVLSLTTVSVLALAIGLNDRAAHRASEAAHAAAEAAAHEAVLEARAEAAAEAETVAEAAAETVAEEAVTELAAVAPEPALPADDPQAHGDAGTMPLISIIAGAAVAQSVDSPAIEATGVMYGLGRAALPEEVAAWDTDVRPDGLGLPAGSGSVEDGEGLFSDNCAVCHGEFGEGVDRWPILSGGQGSLTHERPEKTIGSFWPYLSTAYDYIHRAMPFGNAHSLEPDQTYAIVAYLLYMNDVVDDEFVLSNENFAEVRLPNEENFFMDDRAEGEIPAFTVEPCMANCKGDVRITARAAVLDVTPEDGSEVEGMDLEGGGGGSAAMTEEIVFAAEPAAAPAVETAAEPVAEVIAAAADAGGAPDPALVAAGEKVFRQCKACHAVGEGAANKVGPVLNGIIGQAAGSVEGFKYSSAVADSGIVWTSETLHGYLADPKGYIPGNKMAFRGLKKPEDVDAVVAYLMTFSE